MKISTTAINKSSLSRIKSSSNVWTMATNAFDISSTHRKWTWISFSILIIQVLCTMMYISNPPKLVSAFKSMPISHSHCKPNQQTSATSRMCKVFPLSIQHVRYGTHQMLLRGTADNDVDSTTVNDTSKKGIIVVVGASGYIGKAVVRECLRQNYKTFAFVRKLSDSHTTDFSYKEQSATPVLCDVTNAAEVAEQLESITKTYCSSHEIQGNNRITAVVSCLASRSGVKKDAYLIDYQATLNCLEAAVTNQAKHFILLSAFCVQKPLLQFQQAKLKFEAALQEEGNKGNIIYTIVRPTAFFKSVSGQLEVVQSGAPFVLFDKGAGSTITACNPIAESDLATFMIDSITTADRHNRIINLGGPDEPISMLQQGNMLFNATNQEPKFAYAPVWIFDVVINTLQFIGDILNNEKICDMAETGRIGKYYAVEDMVTTKPEEKYGTITLQEHYNRIAIEGNDYDPYTTMFARARGIDVAAIQNDMKNNNVTSNEEVILAK